MQMTVKIVNVFDGNLAVDLPNHLALINLFDPVTGATSCVMDGTYITGVRTAASAVLSARMLSRAGSRVATVDRRRRAGARTPAPAAVDSGARPHQRVLAARRGCPEAGGREPDCARDRRRRGRGSRGGHRLPGGALAGAGHPAGMGEARRARVVRRLLPAGRRAVHGSWRGIIASSSRRSTHFSRHRSAAASSRASTPPAGRRLAPSRSAESLAASARRKSRCTRRWASPWRTWSPPISRISGPGARAAAVSWPGDDSGDPRGLPFDKAQGTPSSSRGERAALHLR